MFFLSWLSFLVIQKKNVSVVVPIVLVLVLVFVLTVFVLVIIVSGVLAVFCLGCPMFFPVLVGNPKEKICL